MICVFFVTPAIGQIVDNGHGELLKLTPSVRRIGKNAIMISLSVKNSSNSNLLVAKNPRQVDGHRGFYVVADGDQKSTIVISSRVFGPSNYVPYRAYTGVELVKLMPNESMNFSIRLDFPISETVPPVDDPYMRRKLSLKSIKSVKIEIGYFPESAGLLEILNGRKICCFVIGHESIRTGIGKYSRLYEVQRIAVADIKP